MYFDQFEGLHVLSAETALRAVFGGLPLLQCLAAMQAKFVKIA